MVRSFLLGTIFGIAISSLLSFASHMFWNYAFPEQWRRVMSPLVFSLAQVGILALFTAVVVVVYFILEQRNKKHEEDLEEARIARIIKAINENASKIIKQIRGEHNERSTKDS